MHPKHWKRPLSSQFGIWGAGAFIDPLPPLDPRVYFCYKIIVVISQLGIAVYRKYWFKTLQNINFDNPVYRKTTEESVNMERGTNGLLTNSDTSASINNPTSTTRTFTSTTLVTDASEVTFVWLFQSTLLDKVEEARFKLSSVSRFQESINANPSILVYIDRVRFKTS